VDYTLENGLLRVLHRWIFIFNSAGFYPKMVLNLDSSIDPHPETSSSVKHGLTF